MLHYMYNEIMSFLCFIFIAMCVCVCVCFRTIFFWIYISLLTLTNCTDRYEVELCVRSVEPQCNNRRQLNSVTRLLHASIQQVASLHAWILACWIFQF